MISTERIQYLLGKYAGNSATAEEVKELFLWMENEDTENAPLRELLQKMAHEAPADNNYNPEHWEHVFQSVLKNSQDEEDTPVVKMRRVLPRWVAAASIIFLLGLGSYFLFFNKAATHSTVQIAQQADVQSPSSNRATITLVDGSEIYLDSAANGQLALEGSTRLIKLDNGQVAYQPTANQEYGEVVYNTLNNPRGSKVINMALSDGSQVWLNAGSSITYPVAFTGNERKISVNGEAYFEVAHDAARPFYVTKGDMQVRVLGTHFNVNAYDDEEDIKVTLLEGSVKIARTGKEQYLKPGQQAIINKDISLANAVDMTEVMAWKNGKFVCINMSLEAIMRQLSRWYDVEVVYKDKINDNYTVDVSRIVPVSQLFHFIEMSGGVHFTIENKKIIVSK